jgi:hypothetical protein
MGVRISPIERQVTGGTSERLGSSAAVYAMLLLSGAALALYAIVMLLHTW